MPTQKSLASGQMDPGFRLACAGMTTEGLRHRRQIRLDAATARCSRAGLPLSKGRREEFTPPEYHKLHSFARSWIKAARNDLGNWYRTMAYNFVLIG